MPKVTTKASPYTIEGNSIRFRTPDGKSMSLNLTEDYITHSAPDQTDIKIYVRKLEGNIKQIVAIFPDGKEQILLTEAP